jgi:hypothetical protein
LLKFLIQEGKIMKKGNLVKPFHLWKMAFVLLTLLFSTMLVSAQCEEGQTVSFLAFTQTDVSAKPFQFTNEQFSGTFSANTEVNVTFSGAASVLNGPANLIISNTTTTAPATEVGLRTIQPFNNTFRIAITRGGLNLLTAVVTHETNNFSEISGDTNNVSSSAGYSAATPNQNITYTSDFFIFSGTAGRNFSLSFSAITPNYVRQGIFLNTFTASGTGLFSSCGAPQFTPPTAAPAEIKGRVLTNRGRGLARARVTLTDSAGQTFSVSTNSLGYYRFTGIDSGQSVVISVNSKQYRYAPKVITVGEDLYDMDFVPE